MLFLLAGLLSLSAVAAQNQGQPSNRGVIYGTVIAQDGTPAKGLTLNARPLGVALGMALPWTKTNDAGFYRFEQLAWGRYTVYAEDHDAGYSSFSTGSVGGSRLPEVELTAGHPEAEFNVTLPPPSGFLHFHLTNRSTGAPISGVEVTVMTAEIPPKTIFSEGCSSSQAILVPSDKDLLLHVTSWGFLEWEESAGAGKPIHIAPGNSFILDVQLEPSNPLQRRIPGPDPKKYQGIRDAKDWRNPYLIVRPDGIEVVGVTDGGSPMTVDAVTAVLERLPDSAWPYGLVVAIQGNGRAVSESDRSRIETNRNLLLGRLNDLGVIVGFWPQ
jgi:hypothetical protein